MKRIAIDMDEVIADFIGKYLLHFNRNFNGSVTVEQLHGTRFQELNPQMEDYLHVCLEDPLFFGDLPVMPDSQEVIRELSERYEIFIATAAMEVPASFTAKYRWLKEHFPFLNEMNFVFCGDKSIIDADYLIDDNSRHFKRFKGQGILYTSPLNVYETGFVRVNNWREVRAYFQSLND